jgi:hypothetical protein
MRTSVTLSILSVAKFDDEAVEVESGCGSDVQIGEEVDEVLRAGWVGNPGGQSPVVHLETGEQHGSGDHK